MADVAQEIKQTQEEFEERIIEIRRTTKVTKGGKNLGFRALAVVSGLARQEKFRIL